MGISIITSAMWEVVGVGTPLIFLVFFPTLMQFPHTLELMSTQFIIQGGVSEDPRVFFLFAAIFSLVLCW